MHVVGHYLWQMEENRQMEYFENGNQNRQDLRTIVGEQLASEKEEGLNNLIG